MTIDELRKACFLLLFTCGILAAWLISVESRVGELQTQVQELRESKPE